MLVASAAVHQNRSVATVAVCAGSRATGDLTKCVARQERREISGESRLADILMRVPQVADH